MAEMARNKLLRQIQALKFAILDVGLYLDGHPDNQKALRYFNQMKAKLETAVSEYEAAFGPLTMLQNNSETTWHWVAAPWPWEMEG